MVGDATSAVNTKPAKIAAPEMPTAKSPTMKWSAWTISRRFASWCARGWGRGDHPRLRLEFNLVTGSQNNKRGRYESVVIQCVDTGSNFNRGGNHPNCRDVYLCVQGEQPASRGMAQTADRREISAYPGISCREGLVLYSLSRYEF